MGNPMISGDGSYVWDATVYSHLWQYTYRAPVIKIKWAWGILEMNQVLPLVATHLPAIVAEYPSGSKPRVPSNKVSRGSQDEPSTPTGGSTCRVPSNKVSQGSWDEPSVPSGGSTPRVSSNKSQGYTKYSL